MYIPGLTPEEFFQMYGEQLEPEVAKVIENLLADQRKQQGVHYDLLNEIEALEDEVHILESELKELQSK